jgi:hypothetical protein
MPCSILRLILLYSPLILVSLLCFSQASLAHAQTDASGGKSRLQQATELYKESNWLAATGKREQAVASYDAFDEKFGKDDDLAIQTLLVKALTNRSTIIGNLNRLSDEVAALDAIILRYGASQTTLFDEHIAAAFNNKIYALKRQSKFTEALLEYDKLEARFGQNPAPQVRAAVAKGLFNKAEILEDIGQLVAAVAVYEEVDSRYGQDNTSEVREQVFVTLVRKALIFERLNKTTYKVLTYLAIYRRFGGDRTPTDMLHDMSADTSKVHEEVAAATLQRFYGLTNYDDKLAVAEELERQFAQDQSVNVMKHVRNGMNSMGYASILRAKEFWANKPLRTQLLESAVDKLQLADDLQIKMKVNGSDYWYVNGNLGYALFLSGYQAKAKALTQTTLKLGGRKALEGQRKDAKLFRVEPKDTRYEAMLNKLWKN